MLDKLEDFSENILEAEDGETSEFTSKMIVQWEQDMKVNWALMPSSQKKDTSRNYSFHIHSFGIHSLDPVMQCELGLTEKQQQQCTGCLEKDEVQLDSTGMFQWCSPVSLQDVTLGVSSLALTEAFALGSVFSVDLLNSLVAADKAGKDKDLQNKSLTHLLQKGVKALP
ncbi:hypothetical protein P4O66_022241 [Electrophorus voltai]|uniref:Uncharacterized protein n=1 Tax=Electrophorus voltai TaxID=2609070 RepID=A0AAD8ZPD8_9TELE|nr:hypothetical protein P4O66_022241 [Electrophorus voltai]